MANNYELRPNKRLNENPSEIERLLFDESDSADEDSTSDFEHEKCKNCNSTSSDVYICKIKVGRS